MVGRYRYDDDVVVSLVGCVVLRVEYLVLRVEFLGIGLAFVVIFVLMNLSGRVTLCGTVVYIALLLLVFVD